MVQKIDATLQRADALVTAARDGATPRHVVDRIVAAGGDARAEDCAIYRSTSFYDTTWA